MKVRSDREVGVVEICESNRAINVKLSQSAHMRKGRKL